MQPFVEVMLRHIPDATTAADIETLLGHLAEHLGFRSGFLLLFPVDADAAVRLWDSNAERSTWWRKQTDDGTHTISRSLAAMLAEDGVRHVTVEPDDVRYAVARAHDFASTTVVPITFDAELRGIACFAGDEVELADVALSLQIVCYALLMQARTIAAVSDGAPGGVSLTPREREVMELSAQGFTSDMVAAQLGMSPRTVNQHVDNIAYKLKTKNRVHTVAEAIRRGLLA